MIWLVRHGESQLNADGVRHGAEQNCRLTPTGAAQAWQAGIELAHLEPHLILCSPLSRAMDTASIIGLAAGTRPPVYVMDALTERAYTDGTWLETCAQAANRAAAWLARFERDLVAVTHAGVIKGLLGLDVTPPNGSIHAWRP